ncbi:uncharacterized protein LOC105391396 [Plutella xylostella]|uniref:uncharacterized protein LOC105391396 n=1 Tax=Plutella xylostella TaxID=51655 RepID=UPI002032B1D2|nr:uncharacterized protein LOC105391396 [Plutella xylostella]
MTSSRYALIYLLVHLALGVEWPQSCSPGQYFDPGLMVCQACPANSSMVPDADGFSCTCSPGSRRESPARCLRCSSSEQLAADGGACVPRRCQKDAAGRVACRKCPADYIAVTQNWDGSPLREVQCVKCARGYRAQGNACVRCDACACPRNHVPVRGSCVPKAFLTTRPKYEEKMMTANELLDVVKFEYLCTLGDVRACRRLANLCVRSLNPTDRGGPCRLWTQPAHVPRPAGLPVLLLDLSSNNGKNLGEIQMSSNKDTLLLTTITHTSDGGMKLPEMAIDSSCFLPKSILIGRDLSIYCKLNITDLEKLDAGNTLAPYISMNGNYQPIPVAIRKPNGKIIQRAEWSSNKFRRYFLLANATSATNNITSTVYLRIFTVFLKVQREKTKSGGMVVSVSVEAQYASKSPVSTSVPVSFRVHCDLPPAGVLRGLEIWGGVFGAFLAVYAVIQWRGAVKRGALYISLLPIMTGCIADALYFAALFSSLHTAAAEAGAPGLPLSRGEEHTVAAFIYAAISLKIVKVAWVNWKQCNCDIFFLDWSEYNPQTKVSPVLEKSSAWKTAMVAREWSLMQARRRVHPGFTVALTLILIHLTSPWLAALPPSAACRWALHSACWWAGYLLLAGARWLSDRLMTSPAATLPRLCEGLGVSVLVFQEELYAHYVHGRNDDSPDARALAGPLSSCRVVCAPQFRTVYKQLSVSGPSYLGDNEARRALLSRFLAAFFERALDGMRWVGCERSLLERLLDVEVTSREAGATSVLLYDPQDNTASCFMMTWWGEEWSLVTLDAALLGVALVSGGEPLLAGLVVLCAWQVSSRLRHWLGCRNVKKKTDVHII